MIDDEFRTIAGYPGYRVNRAGDVQSCWGRTFYRTLTETWRPLKPSRARRYFSVNLSDSVRKRHYFIHRLVLETFVGPRPDRMVCCPNDGDPANNRLQNLRWDTSRANEADKLRHGTRRFGSRAGSKLSEEQVREIRRLRSAGVPFKDLAATYGVCPQNIQAIVYRKSWKHLP